MSYSFLEKLKIKNFRNLEDDIVSFGPKVNYIFGENGNGKTNLLEAIYIILEGKSFRKNTKFPQMININGEEPEIIFQTKLVTSNTLGSEEEGGYQNTQEREYSYSGKLMVQKNEYFLNGRPTKKKCGVHCVFINPFDSLFFYQIPLFRRQWFDQSLSSIDEQYRKVLRRYQKALKMRNSLLFKKKSHYLEYIKAIDGEIAKDSFFLVQKRIQFLRELEGLFTQTFREFFSQDDEMKIKMQSKFALLSIEDIYSALQCQLEKDIPLGKTSYGIHRDDYALLFNGLNAFEICSLGQQKMSFLSLSFAYIELFKYKLSAYPIVLIDDVSGELDQKRWGNLIQYICVREFQTFITTANEDFRMKLEHIEGIGKLYIDEGKVSIIPLSEMIT